MSVKRSQGTTPGLGTALLVAGQEGSYSGTVRGSDSQTTGTSQSLTLPSLSADDLILVFCTSRNSVPTTPTGYTERIVIDLGTDEEMRMWSKVAVGTETTTDFTATGADTTSAVVVLSGDYYDHTYATYAQGSPALEGEATGHTICCFMANYTSTPWTEMAGVFGGDWTVHENVSGTSTDLMLIGRDTKFNGPTTPYIAGGGGGAGNQYQMTVTVLVSSP